MTETIFGKNWPDVSFDFFSLAHVPYAEMEGAGFMTYTAATSGWLRCFGFTFGVLSWRPYFIQSMSKTIVLQNVNAK